MQKASSRIWTRVIVSISYDDECLIISVRIFILFMFLEIRILLTPDELMEKKTSSSTGWIC